MTTTPAPTDGRRGDTDIAQYLRGFVAPLWFVLTLAMALLLIA